MKYLNYLLIFVGSILSFYAKFGANENLFVLICGIVILMLGIYRISKTIPSKHDEDEFDTDFKSN